LASDENERDNQNESLQSNGNTLNKDKFVFNPSNDFENYLDSSQIYKKQHQKNRFSFGVGERLEEISQNSVPFQDDNQVIRKYTNKANPKYSIGSFLGRKQSASKKTPTPPPEQQDQKKLVQLMLNVHELDKFKERKQFPDL